MFINTFRKDVNICYAASSTKHFLKYEFTRHIGGQQSSKICNTELDLRGSTLTGKTKNDRFI